MADNYTHTQRQYPAEPVPPSIGIRALAFEPYLVDSKHELIRYFHRHWTPATFFFHREGAIIRVQDESWIIVLADNLDYCYLRDNPNARVICSFRKRKQDNIGFVNVRVSKKGWDE
jgi:hypothetical protein